MMGPVEVPQQTPQIVKVVSSSYEFGANYVWDKVRKLPAAGSRSLIGRFVLF
jgi:hypothetical protein